MAQNSKQSELRAKAVLGLGLIIQRTPKSTITELKIARWLKCLAKARLNPMGQQNPLDVRCIDTVIATTGQLLKAYGLVFPVILNETIYDTWLNEFPLSDSKSPNKIQLEILLEFLE
jgi:hypothetical protein